MLQVSYLLHKKLIYPLHGIEDGRGDWSSKGCKSQDRKKDVILCRCNHLSTFGVLVVSSFFLFLLFLWLLLLLFCFLHATLISGSRILNRTHNLLYAKKDSYQIQE